MIGIIILNYITWTDTAHCINSILKSNHKDTIAFHIYVVDNASPKKAPENIRELFRRSNVTYIQSKKNVGYAAGNNLGIRCALKDGCTKILITNSDVCFEEGCISGLVSYLEQHPEVGIVGPKILDINGNIQKTCLCRKTGLKEKYLVRTKLSLLFKRQCRTYWGLDKDYDTTFPVYAVTGCCFMVSEECIKKIFPFDEGTFLYEEEFIVGIRMEQAGYETHYYPQCVIHHLHGGSTRKVKPFAYTCEVVSEIYYCQKYLKAKTWQIIPLYIYRIVKYYLKCLRSQDFRKYRRAFRTRARDAIVKNKNLI